MEGTQVAAGYQLQRFGSAPAWPPRRGQWGRARAWGGRGPSGEIRAASAQAAATGKSGAENLRSRSLVRSTLSWEGLVRGRPSGCGGGGTPRWSGSCTASLSSLGRPSTNGVCYWGVVDGNGEWGAKPGTLRWAKSASGRLSVQGAVAGGRRGYCGPSSPEDRCDLHALPRTSGSTCLIKSA